MYKLILLTIACLGVSTAQADINVLFKPLNGSVQQRVKIESAGKKMNEVVHSACFREFLTARKMIETQNKTSTQVVDHLQSLKGTIPVRMYYKRFTSAVAYRLPPDLTININSRFFGVQDSDCDWASVMGHESLGHSLGEYDHSYKPTATRSCSVPYSINAAFEACCK